MLSKNQLLEHLKLQDTMNAVVNPDWLKANYAWTRAIMVEGVEAIDHLGWKWWKKLPDPDMTQFRLELVDIWHFILSHVMVEFDGNHEAGAEHLEKVLAEPRFAMQMDDRHVDIRQLDAHGLLHVLVGAAAFGDVHFASFALLLQRADMTAADLHATYVQKNVLNVFRQAHGYKEGTYVKDWDGAEDNEVLSTIMARHPNLTPTELTAALETAYGVVLRLAAKESA